MLIMILLYFFIFNFDSHLITFCLYIFNFAIIIHLKDLKFIHYLINLKVVIFNLIIYLHFNFVNH